MRLVLLALLIVTMAGSAAAMDFTATAKPTGDPTQLQPTRYSVGCAGVNFDSAFYQDDTKIFGNQLDAGVGGPLTTLTFKHKGYGFAGPYSYNLFVYDFATCTEMYSELGLSAADAAAGAVTEVVTLPAGWVVSGFFFIGIQPLTCLTVGDCYPDVGFDYDGLTPAPVVSGCGSAVDLTDPLVPFCYTITTTDPLNVDFLMSVTIPDPVVTGACCVQGALCQLLTQAACATAMGTYYGDNSLCTPSPCPTPTEVVTWGAVKALYR
jgi:hypothetical protein